MSFEVYRIVKEGKRRKIILLYIHKCIDEIDLDSTKYIFRVSLDLI